MADDNLQVKVEAEVKELFEQMWSESGQSKKDFMASVIAQYQSYSLQKGSELGIPELSALEQHVRRIVEIYTSLAGSRQDIADESTKKQLELNNELSRIKAELLDVKESAKLADSNAKEFVDSIVTKAKEELEANKIKINELISRAEKAEETAMLTKQLFESEQKMRTAAEISVAELTKRVDVAESASKTSQNDVVKLSAALEAATIFGAELNKTISGLKAQIVEIEQKHVDQITSIKDHADIERERAVLVAEKASFDRIQKLQDSLIEAQKIISTNAPN